MDALVARWRKVAVDIVTHPDAYTESQRALAWRFLLAHRAH